MALELDANSFLSEHWQRKPLLLRGAVPISRLALSPEDLAGLACDEALESRIVLRRGGQRPWEVRHGPFDEDDFATLPERDWTLLVHEVNTMVPEVAELLEHFRFLPNWRIDDVMVSYAPPGGGVGAHVDHYDVFLVQGSGRRRWRIERRPVEREVLVPGADARVLAEFTADAEWVLAPGDLLYLPPRIAHEGVALDDCMTYSVGFRAPAPRDIAAGFLAHLVETLEAGPRYSDAGRAVSSDPGRIEPAVVDWAAAVLRAAVADREAIARWFGRFVTEPRRGEPVEAESALSGEDLARALRDGSSLRRVSPARLAWSPGPDDGALLFAGGEEHRLGRDTADAAALLCGREPLTEKRLRPHLAKPGFAELLARLVARGVLAVENA